MRVVFETTKVMSAKLMRKTSFENVHQNTISCNSIMMKFACDGSQASVHGLKQRNVFYDPK